MFRNADQYSGPVTPREGPVEPTTAVPDGDGEDVGGDCDVMQLPDPGTRSVRYGERPGHPAPAHWLNTAFYATERTDQTPGRNPASSFTSAAIIGE
jgi:hypothetical protein